MVQIEDIEWKIFSYIIRKRGLISASEIKEGLKLPSLFWAEHYLHNMLKKGIINKEGEKFYLTNKSKFELIFMFFRRFKDETIKRYYFYISFLLTSTLLYIIYFIYLPKNEISYIMYGMILCITFIIFMIYEYIKYHKFKYIFGD